MQNGKKTFIVGMSMVKEFKMKKVNKLLYKLFAKLRLFHGTTLKHLNYYVVSSLIKETLGRIILHGGCNDLNNKKLTSGNIGNDIGDMAILFHGYGVNDTFISAMICRKFIKTWHASIRIEFYIFFK